MKGQRFYHGRQICHGITLQLLTKHTIAVDEGTMGLKLVSQWLMKF